MKPDACIDLLKTLAEAGVHVSMYTERWSVNGVKVPVYKIDAEKSSYHCHYEFIKDMLVVSDPYGFRVFTDIDDVVFIAKDGVVTAMINRKLEDRTFYMMEEKIYGETICEYTVRTV